MDLSAFAECAYSVGAGLQGLTPGSSLSDRVPRILDLLQ